MLVAIKNWPTSMKCVVVREPSNPIRTKSVESMNGGNTSVSLNIQVENDTSPSVDTIS